MDQRQIVADVGSAFRTTVPTSTDFAAAPHSSARRWRDCREPLLRGME